MCIRDGILNANREMIDAKQEISAKDRVANRANTLMVVDSILAGSKYIEQGLLQIASELRYSNILTERRDLEAKIRDSEEWLFENGLIKEFYQTTDLANETIPFVNASYHYFLEHIVHPYIDSKEEEELKEKIKKGEIKREELEESLSVHKKELMEFSINMKCHPLIVLAYLISKNKLGYHYIHDCLYIVRTAYNISVYEIWETDEKFKMWHKLDAETVEYKNGEYRMLFKSAYSGSKRFWAQLSFEEALRCLMKVATKYEERMSSKFGVVLSKRLEWDNFFDELNMNIAMYNLRILAQKLESFKREKRIEMLS